ncbi:MAG: AMP-binding protein [Myxococcales bacterium]|jgi:acyl-CoA synthetase (AMP-forming)/AMP-acid ligase II|nr:AMP-binding protein [Myxococcales bacterium]
MSEPFASIASYLPRMAEQQPHALAIVCPDGRDRHGKARYTHYTYAQLDAQSDLIARGLAAVGIGRGVRTVLMVRPSLEFFALTFALLKGGAVPVMVDPGIGLSSLKTCLAEAAPEAFIGVPMAHAARVVLGWGRSTLQTHVTVGRRWFWGGTTLERVKKAGRHAVPEPLPKFAPEDLAALVYTSGSTGTPKAVVYDHGNFAAQVEMIRDLYDIRPGEIDLPTFPLFALFDPALGMTTIVPDMDPTRPAEVDPRKIIEAVEDFGVTNMFGSPALLDTVGRYGAEHGVKLPSLRRVISAGAPVAATVMERFLGMLEPGARVVTPYGATESLPVASISSDEVLGETRARTDEGAGVCVGRPVDGMRVSIIGIDDGPIERWDESLCLPTNEVGEIVVKGPAVTRTYYGRQEATALAKIPDAEGDGFSHRMGDLGYLDEQGRLWFCGRKTHRVVTAGRTYFTVPCEAIFNTHPQVHRTALVGARRDGEIRPVLCVELERKDTAGDALTAELLALGAVHEHTHAIDTVLYHPGFPVDIRHNAKIGREKLTAWASGRLG